MIKALNAAFKTPLASKPPAATHPTVPVNPSTDVVSCGAGDAAQLPLDHEPASCHAGDSANRDVDHTPGACGDGDAGSMLPPLSGDVRPNSPPITAPPSEQCRTRTGSKRTARRVMRARECQHIHSLSSKQKLELKGIAEATPKLPCWFGSTCKICPLAPLPDELFRKSQKLKSHIFSDG